MTLKGAIAAATMLTAILAADAHTAPTLEFVLELDVRTGEAFTVGTVGNRSRHVVPITGGTFEGPRVRGEVLDGGADYQLADNDHGRTELEAIYCLRTHDGEYIHVRNRGIIAGGYFYTSPIFEASADGPYAWLNNGVYVCRPGSGSKDGIKLLVWKVCDPAEGYTPASDSAPLPDAVRRPAARRGTVETFCYTVRRDSASIGKSAQVYLPYGYDAADPTHRYNVVYLMHGGGDNSSSFFSDPRSPLPLTQVLDHLIADGTMEPVIVVAPTFYDNEDKPGGGMQQTVALTRDFHKELSGALIPALENHYHTFYNGDYIASRDHRAFGGFSMGALTTWYQLAYAPEAARHYIPLSGDLWVYDSDGNKQPARIAAGWLASRLEGSGYANGFNVYAASGTDDIAGTPELNLVEALAADSSGLFRTGGADANLSLSMKPGGKHYYGDINEYLYHILPQIWK